MTQEITPQMEETLDPQDWEAMRALGRRMVDEMLDYTRTIRERPPWLHASGQVRDHFAQPLPLVPQPPEEVYEEFLEYVLPYPIGNIHPRFWGWVFGTGTFFGALAELLTAVMNSNSGGLSYHSANYVEDQVIEWFKELLGFPPSASGLLTSGCSAANLIGLAVARNVKAEFDLRREGVGGAPRKMMLYASQEIHSSVQKAVELLGLGSDALRAIPVDDALQIELGALEAAIAQDRQDGHYPFCIVGGAGTTNTGSIDDLCALADICEKEGLWFHIDGAFGAWAVLSPASKHLVAGMERADSLAFDLHKWMYMPYEIGCVLVRNEEDSRRTFSLMPDYLAHGEGERGLTGIDLPWLSDHGIQLSREFRALKAWMSLKQHGMEKYGRLIQQNIDQAQYLGELVQAAPELELVAPVALNTVCFRYIAPELEGDALDELNRQIEIDLQEQGIAVVSGTRVKRKYVLHVSHTNHRTLREDFDVLVRETIRVGGELASRG